MEEKIIELQTKFSFLKIEKIEEEDLFSVEGETPETDIHYKISNFNGNKNITITLSEEEEVEDLIRVLSFNPILLDEYLGVKYNDKYEILLTPIGYGYIPYQVRRREFDILLNYYNNELKIKLETEKAELPSIYFSSYLHRYNPGKRRYILTIENYKRSSPEGVNMDLRNILNSVLFDFEYSFNVAFEPIELNSLNRRIPRLRRQSSVIPNQAITFTYKKYIQELIQYYHLADKVDHIPFKYLCYFHIIEYFSDKSAYYVVAEQVKHLLLKPDFHLKTDNYINQAVNIFKKENEKHLTDKIKLTRVLQQFVSMTEFQEYLETINLLTHFKQEQIFNCSKPLKIPGLDFGSENAFFQSLTNRVYAIRCSIVHSNPDFDETKAIPFVHNSENVFRLNIEMALVYEISRNIIIKTCETR